MSTDIATQKPKTDLAKLPIRQLLQQEEIAQQVAKAIPKHMTADRFIRVALTALTRTPKLLDCTQQSLMKCIMDCAAMGLEPDGRHAHLIPYGNECTLIIDYKGLVVLCRRSGDVASLHADVVCENDVFEYSLGEVTRHTVDFRKPRGPVYAAYAVATLKDGSRQAAVLTRDEIEAIRARSKAGRSGPWVSDWNEMAKKTAFRRLSKWLVLSPEIREAFDRDDDRIETIETTPRIVETSGSRTEQLAAMLAEPEPEPQPAEDDYETTKRDAYDRLSRVANTEDLLALSKEVKPLLVKSDVFPWEAAVETRRSEIGKGAK